MQPIISIRGISKQFNAVRALDDVSFDVMPGELHAVMGENGAGKSTLMKILSGVLVDYAGELWIEGARQQFQNTRDAEQVGVSIIHQELNLVEQLSVAANIFLGREIVSPWGMLNQAAMDRESARLLSELESNIAPTAMVGTLRVGDQQIIEIAKALSINASILIMDEPTSALTESEVARLYGVIETLRQRGVTILYISHKMDEVFRLADRITVLRDGKFVTTVDRQETSPREIAHLMVGRELEQSQIRQISTGERSVRLAVRNLGLAWPGHSKPWRLQGIEFELRCGEILGIAGLMGAGRTELLECLFGASFVPPTGQILIDGELQSFRHPAEAMQAGLAMVTEDRKRSGLFGHVPVRDNITVCALRELASYSIVSSARERLAAQQQVDRLQIKTDGIQASMHSLSGGNQQKCIIGRCLMTSPKILLLDDPTRGVDVGAKAELYRLMEQLAEAGMSIIVTSSELPELLTVSDRILVLCEGQLTGEFSRSEATEQKIMEAATHQNV
ncbi:sugar ABC transporter ATP-binding protein [Aureliella helgolandensis]|uniref:Ribose import ATP-binding protein RbsA n=1 Tax=Aureliella helgolandensis TaxID=2527968 RepID=A0A518GC85_9BACT|nr:sugar ABC transporter ATP-binding protein [Aureliella helgolandensis]QDV26214.1 Ribose import ATP-binding protein RbsA [Aureliella helgolandensis]